VGRDEVLARVERMRPAMVVWLARRCGSYAEAHDLAAEVIALAAEADGLPEEPAALRRWLVARGEAVARRATRRWARDERVLGQVLSLDEPLSAADGGSGLVLGDVVAARQPPLDDALGSRQLLNAVLHQLESWSETDRQLLLQTADGAAPPALRRHHGLSRFALRRRIMRLRSRLLSELDDDSAAEISRLIGPLPGP